MISELFCESVHRVRESASQVQRKRGDVGEVSLSFVSAGIAVSLIFLGASVMWVGIASWGFLESLQ